MPYYRIKTGDEELHGIFRHTDEHHSEKKVKKSLYNVVYLEPGSDKEIVPIEISYNFVRKAAMIAVKYADGEKRESSVVVKGKQIEDAFPLTMIESEHNWKLMARLPQNLDS